MPSIKTRVAYERIALAQAESLIGELEGAVAAAELAIDNLEGVVPPTGTRTVTATGDITNDDATILADASGGAITLTLPPAATVNHQIRVTKIDATGNTVTIDGDGTEAINSNPTVGLTTQFQTVLLSSDSVNLWYATN
jgi:hypothetical protein